MLRWWFLTGALVLFYCSILLARQGVVQTNDGRTIEGDITDDFNSDTVAIRIGASEVDVLRSDILSIEYGDDITKQFNLRLSQLPATDIRSRLELSRWALDKKQFDLARRAAYEVLRIDPGNEDAVMLLHTIQGQRDLGKIKPEAAAPEAPAVEPAAPQPSSPASFLSQDQIDIVRRDELRPDDTVRVAFDQGLQARYLKESGDDATAFAALDPTGQALRIIGRGDPQLSAGVKILSDPSALDEFHRRIQVKILVGCAAAGCHGGDPSAGDFFLYRDATTTPVWYTNFFILQLYRMKVDSQSTVWGKGPVERRMIDRTHPAQSVLIQYALPRAVAELPHPQVLGWRPLFTSEQDPACQDILRWIGQSLLPLDPDYGIQFALPTVQTPATQPAENP